MAAIALLSLIPWVWGALTDLRHREAPDILWIGLLLLGAASLLTQRSSLVSVGLSAVVLVPLATYLYHRGLIGGADCKALYVLPVVYATLSFPILLLTSLFSIPWLLHRDVEGTVPMLVPLAASVCVVVLATSLL